METIVSQVAPGFVKTESDHGHHDHYGVTDKDAIYSSTIGVTRQVGQVETGLLSAVFKNTFDLSVAIEKVGAANSLAIEKTAAATNLQIVVKAQEGQLLAVQNAAAAAAKMAECCCELKALILAESCGTRELISALNLKNVQDQLTDAKLKIALSERRPLIPGV